MKFAKKSEDKNKISKNEGLFFGQHPLVEKTPTATDTHTHIYTNVCGCLRVRPGPREMGDE